MHEPDSRPDRPRVFCIGLNKTGTTSFHEAMTLLGFRSLHWGGPPIRHTVEHALEAGEPLLSGLDQALDAFSDIEPITQNFDVLDRQYPGSHFVLTVRSIDEWLDSRARHVERNVQRKAAGEYHGTFLTVDLDRWRDEWDRHVDRVRRHFGARDDFLEWDITADAAWAPLTSLLGVDEPDQPFPWVNRHADPASPPD